MSRPRGVAATAAPIAVVLIAVLGTAAHAGDRPGSHDIAFGSAVNQYPTPAGPGFSHLSVSARSRADGTKPRGEVHATGTTGAPNGEFKVAGAVTCLRVDGNRAAIKYRFDQASGSAAPLKGGGVEVFVEDNGAPHRGAPVDANASGPPEPAGLFDTSAAQCDDPNTATYDTVTSGNYVVRDR